jgi:phospholipid/cholesterol/gamma-HCH transport system substrate-binding protein
MNDQAIRFRFGIFVLAGIILLAVLIILFGGFPNYFKRTESFTIVFSNAQGVAPGTPVRRSGVRIGEVRTVTLDNQTGKVNVGIRIDENYFLRKGDRPTLVQGLLGGDSAIAFLPPDDEKQLDPTRVEPGAVLIGVNPTDAGMLMQKAADLAGPVGETLIEIRKTFQSINKLAPIAEGTLKDFREIGLMAKNVGPDLLKTSEEIRLLSKTTRALVPELKKTSDEIQLAARYWGKVGERADVLLRTNEGKIVKTIERMEETLKRVNELFGDENQKSIRDTLKNVSAGTKYLDAIGKDTSELIRESRLTVRQVNESLKRADEAVADLQKVMKLVGDKGPGILKNVDESAVSLNRTLKDVRELIQVFARSEGTVQKFLGDPSLYNNLNDSALMATKILPRLDRVLADVEIFADRLARHPELIGLGGIVRPSSGIKTSRPTPYRIYP